MAVDAAATATGKYQYQYCFPDLRARAPRNMDELQMLQHVNNNNQQLLFNTGAVASGGTQHSGVTSDASGYRRKRGREEQQQPDSFVAAAGSVMGQSRVLGSMGASTSGRGSAIINNVSNSNVLVASLLSQDVSSLLCQQSAEIDALVRSQNDRLRGIVEEATNNHQRMFMAAMEQRVAKRLREKEAEISQVIKKNSELEEKVRQASAESQFWFGAARKAEALASILRTSLEQALLRCNNRPQRDNNGKEQCGDSTDCYVVEADDAQSCCYDDEERQRRQLQRHGGEGEGKAWCCRTCGKKDVCVLLLPCRHLCICKDCEPKVDQCPVCHSSKNASLRVHIS